MFRAMLLCFIFFSSSSFAELAWQFKTDGMVTGQPILHQNLLYLASGETLSVLDKKGQLQWQYQIKAKTYSSVTISNGIIYLLADNGLHAIDMNGQQQWLFASQDSRLEIEGETWGWGQGKFVDPWAWYRSSPVVIQEKIVFGNANGTFAISTLNGKQLWHANTGVTHTKPAYHQGIFIIGSWDNNLYGINEHDGAIAWTFTSRTPQGIMADWTGWEGFNLDPIVHNGVVYVGNRGSYFYAINAQTGIENWSSQYAGTWIGSPAWLSQGNVYFGTSDGFSLVGLNAKTGSQTLLYRNDFYNFAQPKANDSTVYFATLSGKLYGVNKETWQSELLFSTPSSIKNSANMVRENGGLKRKYGVEGIYTSATERKDIDYMHDKLNSILSVTLDKQTIYLGSANGFIYAINL
ncbi:MAG: PQQ-binding-like beta-propeller repeat protein [Colwellia sp.]|nr:PQQ-binding-like beta-propeller repeat protein [Colwellia sp.]